MRVRQPRIFQTPLGTMDDRYHTRTGWGNQMRRLIRSHHDLTDIYTVYWSLLLSQILKTSALSIDDSGTLSNEHRVEMEIHLENPYL